MIGWLKSAFRYLCWRWYSRQCAETARIRSQLREDVHWRVRMVIGEENLPEM
jgi:hypothetical protein